MKFVLEIDLGPNGLVTSTELTDLLKEKVVKEILRYAGDDKLMSLICGSAHEIRDAKDHNVGFWAVRYW